MTRQEKSSGCLSWFLLLFGFTFAGGPLSILFLGPPDQGELWVLVCIVVLFTFIGLGVAYLGLYSMFFSSETVIDGQSVLFKQSGLSHKKWQESLSDYHGVLKHSNYVSGGSNSSGYMVYEISLVHGRNKDRNILLHQSRSSADLDERWQHFSRLLRLPALEESVDGYDVTRFGEVRSQNSAPPESKVEYLTELPRKLGGFRVENRHGGKQLKFYRGSVLYRGLLPIFFGALFGGLPLWIYLTEDPTPFLFIFIGVGALMFFGGLLWTFCLLVSIEILEIQPGEVRHYIRYPWGPQWKKQAYRDDITEISVERELNSSSGLFKLLIKSRQCKIEVDGGLSNDDKAKLRDFLHTRLGLLESDVRPEAV